MAAGDPIDRPFLRDVDQWMEQLYDCKQLSEQQVKMLFEQALARDEEIASFDHSKFVFTDITFYATDQDRTVVVREIDGTLRTATPDEHDRMNRVYYEKAHRLVNAPAVFSDTGQ
ncbi:hypothetical protein PRIPAC_70760 [Pristionchus pacificus]|uniref:Uncharacterized protein n=1 Tax=Pristionchus pacificus TaxID=54126 RepID=A0A2A6CFW5_PRIPA|nr:hypothetical protein PRIPAC_70760 [Pristionchus pacificus]|eukprot:PDM77102.1 hypothetical protein PRIPAC_43014 [Pristionchus pacificus]